MSPKGFLTFDLFVYVRHRRLLSLSPTLSPDRSTLYVISRISHTRSHYLFIRPIVGPTSGSTMSTSTYVLVVTDSRIPSLYPIRSFHNLTTSVWSISTYKFFSFFLLEKFIDIFFF